MILVCWQAEGAQMGFCAPCRYSDQGALLLSGYSRIIDKALCTFRSRSGSLHGAAWSVLAEQRRNEARSSREGGGRLAVRCLWLLGLVLRGVRAVRASVSWPARPAGCANGAKRRAAPGQGYHQLVKSDIFGFTGIDIIS